MKPPQSAAIAAPLMTGTEAAVEVVARVLAGARWGDGPLDERTVWTNPANCATTATAVNAKNHGMNVGEWGKLKSSHPAVCSQARTNNV